MDEQFGDIRVEEGGKKGRSKKKNKYIKRLFYVYRS